MLYKKFYKIMNREEYRILWNDIVRFVDDFHRNPSFDKLRKERSYNNIIANAFYAGVVEELAKKHNISIPQWVYKKKYFLPEPVFLGEFKGEYRILILLETPLAFKMRNIFAGDNILDRC